MKANCTHKNVRIIVIAAFAEYEKTSMYCPDCDKSFNQLRNKLKTPK